MIRAVKKRKRIKCRGAEKTLKKFQNHHFHFALFPFTHDVTIITSIVVTRGGVEDARLEAKDTKKSKAKDSLFEDRPSRGQGQECSRLRPRTKDTVASVLQKKKNFF